ncbi:MAG: class I SAM-dependent DNA methyltransferase [Planctomycetes bacterium]|nr:class I SAM-dependent DNA methyltransferase [Planctomycetota bacterium]
MAGLRRERLEKFVKWTSEHIAGDEKGESQIFLDQLFQGFGHGGVKEAGATLEMRIKKTDAKGTAFADLVWKPVVLIEMKKRGVDLSKHYRQAFDYWVRLVPGRPRYVVLCNFDEFWVYDFETQMDSPVDVLKIDELPSREGPLAFLFPTPEKPVFKNDHEAVTRDAADRLATCFNKLVIRGVDRGLAQRFILQSLVALFAEDIGLLEKYMFTRLLDECDEPQKSYDLLGQLFTEMNTPGKTVGGRLKGVDYFNGGLFAEPSRIELYPDEIVQLRKAAEANWSNVRPEIFGTLFEHSVDQDERSAYGQHFTHPVDIMKIVGPTIVRPWRELIENATSIKRLLELRKRLTELTVLDPACGSGNFLYIAYREMKRLEARIFERINELSTRKEEQRMIGFVTANQFYGIDINPLGIELAKVTMMIARKLAIDELKIPERALPLDNLNSNFIAGDALIRSELMGLSEDRRNWRRPLPDDEGKPVPIKWPKADVIIGNPPFNGAKKLKPDLGPDYVNAIRAAYPKVPGMADYCVLWFRKSHDHLPECTATDPIAGRAGLVGTQNIRNNKSRVGGLDHIAASGTIIEAVDNQPWSGEANVHVSIPNWVKHEPVDESLTQREQAVVRKQLLIPDNRRMWFKVDPEPGKKKIRKKGSGPASKEYELAFRDSAFINPALSDSTDVTGAQALGCNTDPQRCFNGQMLGHDGFLLTERQRDELIRKDVSSATVTFPYLNGLEVLTRGRPDRYVLDFEQMDQFEAASFPAAFEWVRSNVLPDRERKAQEGIDRDGKVRPHHKQFLARWWQLSFGRPEMLSVIKPLPRYLSCAYVTKRPIFMFISSSIRPSNLIEVFGFPDDYSFGILQSHVHWLWFVTKCGKLKSDFRYSAESVYDTFPWPQSPSVEQIDAVAEAGREVRRVRGEALEKIKGGLRAVYRTLELPGKNPLKDAHAALDKAVLDAYGFSPKKDLLAQLLELNLDVAARSDVEQAVTPPGIPEIYPDPSELITDDCIRPANDE